MLFYWGSGPLGRLIAIGESIADVARTTRGRLLDVLFAIERRVPFLRDVRWRLR